jgi:hypothetical protein
VFGGWGGRGGVRHSGTTTIRALLLPFQGKEKARRAASGSGRVHVAAALAVVACPTCTLPHAYAAQESVPCSSTSCGLCLRRKIFEGAGVAVLVCCYNHTATQVDPVQMPRSSSCPCFTRPLTTGIGHSTHTKG